MDVQLGYWRRKIYRWNEHPNPFQGRSDLALSWLRRFQSDRLVMSELRTLLDRAANPLSRSSDDAVLKEVAARLSSGEFHICTEYGHPIHMAVADVQPADPDAAAKEALENAPPARAPAPPPPAPAPAPAPTIPENADAAQIASVLTEAAQEGAPFCEVCEKAKAEEAAAAAAAAPKPAAAASPAPATKPPAPPPAAATFPPTLDAAAVAQGLQNAAEKGTPFCAECEKARRDAEARKSE